VGNYYNPSIESIVALEPDLVLTDGYSHDLLTQLDGLGITYLVIQPYDVEDIINDVELVGRVTGMEDAATELVTGMREQMAEVAALVQDAPAVKVFYAVDMTDPNNPWTAGPGSMIDWLITHAGGVNIVANVTGEYVQYSIEKIVDADPEVIIYPLYHGSESISDEVFLEHPAWSQTTAVRQGRLYSIDAYLVDNTGPRITQALEEMAKLIHPELFD
jgi:iron complex transport system substrate-binding protein